MNEINKGKLQMSYKKLDKIRSSLYWPDTPEKLPAYTWKDIKDSTADLVVVDGLVHDVSEFTDEHPGLELLRNNLKKDVTHHFYGKSLIYKHSQAAHNLLTRFRCGTLVNDTSPTKAAPNKLNLVPSSIPSLHKKTD